MSRRVNFRDGDCAGAELLNRFIKIVAQLDQRVTLQLRDELSVYTKVQAHSLLAGKANAGHIHGFSLYTGTAGDPPHEHLVQGTTGNEQ